MYNYKKIMFLLVFIALGLLALQVPVAKLAGSKVAFTLFDFFGPIAPAFVGTIPGIIAVFLMQLLNFVIHGAQILDWGTIIRFFPMLFAAFYFGKTSKWNWIIPMIAIFAFNLHPIGRTVWYYSLFWLIPIIAYPYKKQLLAKSLGATFTAHAVGGALWIYAFNLPQQVWINLIPVVIVERLVFALGIALSYLAIKNLIALISSQPVMVSHEIHKD